MVFGKLGRGVRGRVARLVDDAVRVRLDARVEQHEAWLQGQIDRIVARVETVAEDTDRRGRRDVFRAAEREAVHSSARFAYEHFPTATTFDDKARTLEHAVALAPAGGLALEFGVYSGSTLRLIAELRDDEGAVFGFDSFEGLPEDWRSTFPAATFAVDELPEVPGAELVVGWFDETLPPFLAEHDGPVTLLHVDGDLYSSARTVLELCGPRLVEGSVVVFDEYFNFPGWEQHEHRAWQEYVAATGTEFVYEAYTVTDEQVVVRIIRPGSPPAA